MFLTRLFQRYAIALLALGLALLTGCTDQMLTEPQPEPTTDESAATSDSKLRYAHLVADYDDPNDTSDPSKRILQRYEDISTDTDFIVGLEDTVLEPQRILQRYEDLEDVTVKKSFDSAYPGFSVHVKKKALETFLGEIDADANIQWVEPDPTVKAKKASFDRVYSDGEYLPTGIDAIEAELFSGVTLNDGSTLSDYTDQVHVFVLDSGIQSPDVNVCETRSFTDEDKDGDSIGHGTHIAGTIGAKDNSEGIQGIAPNVCLHDYRVMSSDGKTMLSDVVNAVDHITRLKLANPDWPMVVNISLGADVGSTAYNALDEAIQTSIDAGVVYVLAAGNDGIDASTVTPARVEGAITVAAHDNQSAFAGFSNHGALIDIVAPGVDIVSLPNTLKTDAKLAQQSGTSMAAGHVSGAAALYLTVVNPWASPAEVRDQLRSMSGQTTTGAPDATDTTQLYLGQLFDRLTAQLGDDLL
jgi:subtilisin family serine protease